MQKLSKRETYTPTDIPQVRSNCDVTLNSPVGVRDSVLHLKTFDNNPDAALTAKEQAGQDLRVPAVYVLNQKGKPLMPCSPRKARKLLKEKKAKVVKLTPFTIQLLYPSGETKQEISLGVDGGFNYVGLSAITEKKELFCSQTALRSDIVKLNSERRAYRRTRRNRKTWYRKARFLNRGNKKKGWLAPSIQHKLDSHIKLIGLVESILPVSRITIEVAAFDVQKIKNPEISGIEYQRGEQLDFWNIREYILHRDSHKCQHCKGGSKDKILNVHHIESRKTGGDRPDNLLTLCKTCHDKYHKGDIKLVLKKTKGFRAETFMSTIRWRLVNTLRQKSNNVFYTYGFITKNNRIKNSIPKTHYNDAFVIAGGQKQLRSNNLFYIKQVRKCNRKLYKGIRSSIRNTAPRFIKGFQRYDKVEYKNQVCFIFGRRSTGYFDLRLLDGTKLHATAKAKDCKLIQSTKTFVIEEKAIPLLPEGKSLLAS